MNDKDNLLSKDSLKKAISTIGEATYTLIYDGNDTISQILAGKELLQAKWILATICDHVYDYYPLSYFMNDDDKKDYPSFLKQFHEKPDYIVRNAISYVENNFNILETVIRDEYNQHRIPRRNYDDERHVLNVLKCIQNDLSEFVHLLQMPKKVSDPSKPTETEIKNLIEAITNIQNRHSEFADNSNDPELSIRIFKFNQFLEMYKNPLLMAWQLYKYGWHSDFWEEGHSMFDFMLFETQAREITSELIKTLEDNSPFAQFERCSLITNGLLHVYRHLLTQDLESI